MPKLIEKFVNLEKTITKYRVGIKIQQHEKSALALTKLTAN
jgi:hypothetical protein